MNAPGRKEVSIDFDTQTVYGWEGIKDIRKVKRIMELLDQGIEFPGVPVIQSGPDLYLDPRQGQVGRSFPVVDGGHHRACAYFVSGRLLPAILSDYNEEAINYPAIAIPEIRLMDGVSGVEKLEDTMVDLAACLEGESHV